MKKKFALSLVALASTALLAACVAFATAAAVAPEVAGPTIAATLD